jgi:glutamate N-acetyltransferase / amino-acid N-acetyltransferase
VIVPGFQAAGLAAGIKKQGGLDLALIVADNPAAAAGVFTRNRVKAAPVLLCRRRVRSGRPQAILVNSGNANACTGPQGKKDVRDLTREAARLLAIPEVAHPARLHRGHRPTAPGCRHQGGPPRPGGPPPARGPG